MYRELVRGKNLPNLSSSDWVSMVDSYQCRPLCAYPQSWDPWAPHHRMAPYIPPQCRTIWCDDKPPTAPGRKRRYPCGARPQSSPCQCWQLNRKHLIILTKRIPLQSSQTSHPALPGPCNVWCPPWDSCQDPDVP